MCWMRQNVLQRGNEHIEPKGVIHHNIIKLNGSSPYSINFRTNIFLHHYIAEWMQMMHMCQYVKKKWPTFKNVETPEVSKS